MSVSLEIQKDVAVIKIDDGNKNVINHTVLDELEQAFDTAESEGMKAILFKGRPGSFCAGYDISVMTGDDPEATSRLGKRGGLIARRILGSSVPVVGFSQGHAFTIGAVWLSCCDIAIGETGKFKYGMTEVALNVPLNGWALAPMLAKIKPWYQTSALLHSKVHTPEEALEAGFIDQLLPEGEGFDIALESAVQLTKLPAPAYKATKMAIRGSILEVMDRDLG